MQPFGYKFVGFDGGLEVFNIEVLVNGDLIGETGVCWGSTDVDRLWGAVEVSFFPSQS